MTTHIDFAAITSSCETGSRPGKCQPSPLTDITVRSPRTRCGQAGNLYRQNTQGLRCSGSGINDPDDFNPMEWAEIAQMSVSEWGWIAAARQASSKFATLTAAAKACSAGIHIGRQRLPPSMPLACVRRNLQPNARSAAPVYSVA